MITKETIINQIEIGERGHVSVRRATYFLEDGKRASEPVYQRVAYSPGDNVTLEDKVVQEYCKLAWTDKVIAAFKLTQLNELKEKI